jgi:hypothetical protein
MGAVGGAEGVVHVDVPQAGQLPGELRVVFFFLRMKAQVSEQQHLAVLQLRRGCLGRLPDTVVGENPSAEQLLQDLQAGPHGHVIYPLAVRPARCDIRMSRPPCPDVLKRGSAARMRAVSSATLPPLSGTLKSTHQHFLAFLTSRSSIVAFHASLLCILRCLKVLKKMKEFSHHRDTEITEETMPSDRP